MDHYFPGDYLKVYKPIVDGSGQVVIEGGRVKEKITHLPITAFAELTLANAKLSPQQQMRIERVTENPITLPARKQAPQPATEEEDEAPAPAKRGPKPKNNDLA